MDSVIINTIEYRFLFEEDCETGRFVDMLDTYSNDWEDFEYETEYLNDECLTPEDNIIIFKLMIKRELFTDEDDYLRMLIKAAQAANCRFIEETINVVSEFKPERIYAKREF
jgi:hypothetical protein